MSHENPFPYNPDDFYEVATGKNGYEIQTAAARPAVLGAYARKRGDLARAEGYRAIADEMMNTARDLPGVENAVYNRLTAAAELSSGGLVPLHIDTDGLNK